MLYADVIIDISHEKVDHTFQYHIPTELEALVGVGSLVEVPFGKGNTGRDAYVVGIGDTPKIDKEKIKDIKGLKEGALPIESQLIQLSYWMKSHYGSTLTKALKTVIPIKKIEKPKEKKILSLNVSREEALNILDNIRQKKRYSLSKERLILRLLESDSIPWEMVRDKLNISPQTVRDLESKNIISVDLVRDYRDPIKSLKREDHRKILNTEQTNAFSIFKADWDMGDRCVYLLHGVTGSGKTEVYMEMIEKVLSEGREAIVLIPEIALTFQTVMRFYGRFGGDVSIMHSRLSPGERYDQFERAKSGDIKIMVGPRSALFTPFKNLGLIVIDEEHESTYKSEQVPKYHARETAIERARISGASTVLGSATPSLESFYRAKSGEYKLLTLKNRISKSELPECEIIDLRQELKAGNRSVISRRLKELIEDRLNKKEQVILFINRRGMMSFLSCRACGQVIKCPHCDVSLSLHRDGRLHCHYCGYEEASAKICPQCGSKYIGSFRVGTQKIEEVLKETFPRARVLRMDADTTKGKNGHEEILSTFANHGADILVGTQMIVKGHDFPKVTLVGILAADQSLNDHDFRSSERTFQLITQAAGRAGRGEVKGNAIIQTYRPEHYSVVCAANQDYEGFYDKEIEYRRLLSYPPISHMLVIQLFSTKEKELSDYGKRMEGWIDRNFGKSKIRSSGLVDAGISKINDIYRKMIYLKCDDENKLIELKDKVEDVLSVQKDTNVSVYFDYDPMQM